MSGTGGSVRKTVLVTGASRGLGAAIARTFVDRGCNVVATARDPGDVEVEPGRTGEAPASAPKMLATRLDVTDQQSIDQAIALAVERFGGLDILINNAGFGAIGPFEAIDREVVHKQFEVVVFGAMAVVRAALPALVARERATIVNVTSEAGRIGYPYTAVYAAAKHAVEGFSEALRYELAPLGVSVRIVEPGRMRTDFEDQAAMEVSPEMTSRYPSYQKWRRAMASDRGTASPEDVADVVFKAAMATSQRLRWRAKPTFLHVGRLMPDTAIALGLRTWLER